MFEGRLRGVGEAATVQDSLAVFAKVGIQDGLAVLAKQLRVNRRKVATTLPSTHPRRRWIVPLVVLESPLPQRCLLLLVCRLVHTSVVSGAQRHLITRFDLTRRNVVHFVPAQGSIVFPPLSFLVLLHVGQCIFFSLLHFVELALMVSRVRRYGWQALIPPHRLIFLVGRALPARQRASLVVRLR